MVETIILIILLLALIGALPSMGWNAGRSWGYYPSGGIGLVLVIVLVLYLLHVI
jgi:hypothetical protein